MLIYAGFDKNIWNSKYLTEVNSLISFQKTSSKRKVKI